MERHMNECPKCGRDVQGQEACAGCGWLQASALCERHPDREAKGQCVICTVPVCAECDRNGQREFLCPEHHAVEVVDGWAQVYTTSDDTEAQLVRDNLRAEGTDAEVLSQKDHFAVPVDLGELSPVRVLVPAYAFNEAMSVLARHMDAQGEVAFACPECGEAYEPGESVCSSCGTPLPRALSLSSDARGSGATTQPGEQEIHVTAEGDTRGRAADRPAGEIRITRDGDAI
jgi:hypothetical protein